VLVVSAPLVVLALARAKGETSNLKNDKGEKSRSRERFLPEEKGLY
jgi:hypothetical protein